MDRARPRRARSAAISLLAVGLAALAPTPASAQIDVVRPSPRRAPARRPVDTIPRAPHPIVLTVEGGGSLGVYEAGMTWALVEMFKRKRAIEERDPRWMRRAQANAEALQGLPWLRLAAVTGASSGSVNAFYAATSWCDRALDERPEDSPFWRAWVSTGLTQLLPRGAAARAEGGILAHGPVFESVFGWTRGYWRERDWDPECAVEFGATVTRLRAEPVPVNRAIQAGNMRWASTFTVRGGARGPRLVPRAGDQREDYRLGRVAMLPPVGDTIPVSSAMRLLQASSAYPLAFGPVPLAFCRDSVAPARGGRCAAGPPAQFVDGGVFDNAPLALGFGLLLRDSSLTVARFPYALYLSPQYRRRWPDGRTDGHGGRDPGDPKRATGDAPARGLQALVTLAAEAVPTAREYELQFASRLLPREVERLAQIELLRAVEQRAARTRDRAVRAETRAGEAERRGVVLASRARCLDSLLLRSRSRVENLRRLIDSLHAETDSLRAETRSLRAEVLQERRRADSIAAAWASRDDSLFADTTDTLDAADSLDADGADADTVPAVDSAAASRSAPDDDDADGQTADPSCAGAESEVDAALAAAAYGAYDAGDDTALAPAAPRSPLDDYVRATGRWHPIAGEWLGGFGAFLGRPLREYDFYVGVYDALALIAHDVSCAGLGAWPAPRALQGCVRDSLLALIERPPLPLGDVAPRVLRLLYRAEFGMAVRAAPGRASPSADSSFAVVAAVQRALGARMEPMHASREHHCAASGAAAALVCRNGMAEFFRTMRNERRALAVMRARTRSAACAPEANAARAAGCLVERRFLATIADPEGSLGGLLRDGITRLRATTPSGRGGLAPRGVDALAMLYFSTDERARRGFDMGQSSLPSSGIWQAPFASGGRPGALWWMMPSTVALTSRRDGLDLGWELRRHLGASPFALALPVRLNLGPTLQGTSARHGADPSPRLTPGLRLDIKTSGGAPWVSRVSLQGDYWGEPRLRYPWEYSDPQGWRRNISGGVSMSVLAGKVSFSAMSVPTAYRADRRRAEARYGVPVVLGVGLSDVNGMLYWIREMIGG